MRRYGRRAVRSGLARPIASAWLLSALVLTAAPAQSATPRFDAADTSWCGDGSHPTLLQRISGCRIVLALQGAVTKAQVLAHDWRGQFFAEQREYRAALADFNAAIRLDANYAIAYGERADIYLATGK